MNRPTWVAPGHMFIVEPDWVLLPPSFRPRCDSCLRPCDENHDTTPIPVPAPPERNEPRRYWGD